MGFLVRVATQIRRFLLSYSPSMRRPRPDTEWLNDNQWTCRRHFPSLTLPAEAKACWLRGCPSTRPERAVEAPAPESDTLTPPAVAKRRGATAAVHCGTCGDVMWRRPREVRESKTGLFYCGRNCRNAAT